MTNTCILASGGMDSYLVWALHARDADNVFVDIGHKYAYKELTALHRLGDTVAGFRWLVVQGPNLGKLELPSGIIPLRNAHLVLAAAQKYDHIYLGVIAGEINSDKSPAFMQGIEGVLNESWRPQYWTKGRHFTVTAPLIKETKAGLVCRYIDQGGSVEDLLKTVSCYDAGGEHCGKCPSCFKRWVALKINGLANRQTWLCNPLDYGNALGVIQKANHPEMSGWSHDRCRETIMAMTGVDIGMEPRS